MRMIKDDGAYLLLLPLGFWGLELGVEHLLHDTKVHDDKIRERCTRLITSPSNHRATVHPARPGNPGDHTTTLRAPSSQDTMNTHHYHQVANLGLIGQVEVPARLRVRVDPDLAHLPLPYHHPTTHIHTHREIVNLIVPSSVKRAFGQIAIRISQYAVLLHESWIKLARSCPLENEEGDWAYLEPRTYPG